MALTASKFGYDGNQVISLSNGWNAFIEILMQPTINRQEKSISHRIPFVFGSALHIC